MSLDKKLSDLPLETAVTGDHQLYLTNGGQSKRALVSALPIAAEAIAAKDAAEAAAAEAEQTASDILASAGTLKYYADFAAASSDIGNIAESEFVTVAADENNGGLKALYQKVGGVLTLKNVEDAQDTSAFPYLPQDKSQSYWIQKQAVELGLIPQASPSMACRFAKGEYLLAGKRYDDFVSMGGTFTRSTTGTYFGANGKLQTAAIDEPRLEFDPETGEALGLLVEESSENKLLRSEEFDDAAWPGIDVTIIPNAITAPDGNLTADKAVAGTNNSSHLRAQNISAAADTTYTASIFAKAGEYNLIRISFQQDLSEEGEFATFNLETGEVIADNLADGFSMKSVGDGWYRCSLTDTTDSAGTNLQAVYYIADTGVGDGKATQNFVGDGTSGIYIWGAQLEEGDHPTSYIPTTTTTVTRAADVALIDGATFQEFYRASGGAVYVEADYLDGSVISPASRLWTLSSVGQNGARIQLSAPQGSVNTPAFAIVDESGNVDEGGNGVPNSEILAVNRFALTWQNETYNAAHNGILDTATSPSDLDTSVLSALNIGTNEIGTSQLNGHIKSITTYPAAISSDEMVAVTSP